MECSSCSGRHPLTKSFRDKRKHIILYGFTEYLVFSLIMFSFKICFALTALLFAGTTTGHRGPRGRNRGGIFQSELPCVSTPEEQFPCSSKRIEAGVFACRTIPAGWAGGEDQVKTVCADPSAAAETDICGCCEGECPTECPCTCDDGAGYWIEKEPHQGHHKKGWWRRHEDEAEDEEVEEEATTMLVCVPQLRALTAVAMGKATCLATCELP